MCPSVHPAELVLGDELSEEGERRLEIICLLIENGADLDAVTTPMYDVTGDLLDSGKMSCEESSMRQVSTALSHIRVLLLLARETCLLLR